MHNASVLSEREILASLRRLRTAGQVRNRDIEVALGLPSSRVSEIMSGKRRLKGDEMARLNRHFKLSEDAETAAIARAEASVLAILPPILELAGADPDQQRILIDIAQDALRELRQLPEDQGSDPVARTLIHVLARSAGAGPRRTPPS